MTLGMKAASKESYMKLRMLPAVVLAFGLQGVAHAQTDASSQVALIAPQLQTFAGSSANFQALIVGLTQGTLVTLSSTAADGFTQVAAFTPPAVLSAADAARALELARQSLISRAIVAPTAEQLAVTLMGGNLATPTGAVAVRGVLTGTTATNAVSVQRTFTGTSTFAGSAANFDALNSGLTLGRPITLTSATGQAVTFTVPGGPMTVTEAAQALQLAQVLLAQQGILNPTPDQIRAALLGGTVTGINGAVQIAGVLAGRSLNTSASAAGTTSATPPAMLNTSASRTPLTSATPPAAIGTSNSPAITPPTAVTPRVGAAR
jgi:hypothetical protein